MNRSIYFKELKHNRKSFILWTSILVFICILLTALYPQVAGDMKALLSTKMVSENMQEFFGMRMDLWTNVLNYFSTYYGFHVIILSGIFSIVVGSTIITTPNSIVQTMCLSHPAPGASYHIIRSAPGHVYLGAKREWLQHQKFLGDGKLWLHAQYVLWPFGNVLISSY